MRAQVIDDRLIHSIRDDRSFAIAFQFSLVGAKVRTCCSNVILFDDQTRVIAFVSRPTRYVVLDPIEWEIAIFDLVLLRQRRLI
jgi:hypothetical protein